MGRNELKKKLLLIEKAFRMAVDNFRYQEGIRRIEKILKGQPVLKTNERILVKLGLLYDHLAMQQKIIKKRRALERHALKLYRFALRHNKNLPAAVWGIGRVWWHRRSRKAIKYAKLAYRLAKRLHMPAGLYAQNVGAAYKAVGNYNRCEYWLLKGIRECPNDWSVYLNLLSFYKEKKYGGGKIGRPLSTLRRLLKKERPNFKRTKWGKLVQEFIKKSSTHQTSSRLDNYAQVQKHMRLFGTPKSHENS